MALNLKPFEGPRPPDWTDPKPKMAPGPSPQSHDDKQSLRNSDTHLLLIEPEMTQGEEYRLKKLDIV